MHFILSAKYGLLRLHDLVDPYERPAQGIPAECRGHGRVQKNSAERVAESRWARKGSRLRAAHDQRTQSTYLFGALCPERGAGAALVLPACNCEAMQLHLDEIATKVAPRGARNRSP